VITVTDNAKQRLKEIISAKSDSEELGLRLVRNESGQFALVFDEEATDDLVVKHDESKILLVGKDLVDNLEGVVIDREDTPQGSSLVITRK